MDHPEKTAMRRPTLLFATPVFVVAAIGVVAWGFQLTRSDFTTDSPTASEATARRFYDAANRVIATGDVDTFRAVVSPDFVDTERLPGTTPGRSGLERALLDLHATIPGVRLEIDELVADGPEVMARIVIHGDRAASVLGVPVATGPEIWGSVDVLRIAGGQVAERRASVQGTGRLSVLSSSPLGVMDPKRVVVTLERVTLQPMVGFDVATDDHPHTLIAESAGTQLEVRPVDVGAGTSTPDGQSAGRAITLYPEVLFLIPPDTVYTVRNTSSEAVSVLRLSMEQPAPGGPAMGQADPNTDGVTIRTVAGGNATLLPGGTLRAGLGRIALAPGGSLSLSGFEGVMLMEMTTGDLSVSADGESFKRRGTDGSGTVVMQPGLASGDGLLISAGTAVVLRNEGKTPVIALFVVTAMDTA